VADKKAMQAETDRLIREAMEKKSLVIKHGKTRIDAVCGKCGAANRVMVDGGVTRTSFSCKECGAKQNTL